MILDAAHLHQPLTDHYIRKLPKCNKLYYINMQIFLILILNFKSLLSAFYLFSPRVYMQENTSISGRIVLCPLM